MRAREDTYLDQEDTEIRSSRDGTRGGAVVRVGEMGNID